jgi:hypothetical protein
MKQVMYRVLTTALVIVLTLSSCHKVNWKMLKEKHSWNFLISDCDVQRIYTLGAAGNMNVQMKKMYYPDGRIKTIGFYTHSGTSEDVFWHSFSLNYGVGSRTVNIIDSARGAAVLKAIFNNSGRLERFEKLQGEESNFSDLTFEYVNGRLDRINSEMFTYDVNGNIVRREIHSSMGGVVQGSIYTFGAAATDNRQFYMPQYNYMILIDPTMALLEYLGWVKDFSPKSILTSIEYIAPLPQEETFSGHVFDTGGKLTSYSTGDYVGGTKHIDWTCSAY